MLGEVRGERIAFRSSREVTMSRVWVIVANQSEATIYECTGPEDGPRQVHIIRHSAARMRERDLTTDRPGRTFASLGNVRHAFSSPQDARDHEVDVFVREVEQWLLSQAGQQNFDELFLIAGPRVMGKLKAGFSPNLLGRVVGSLNKDVAQHSYDNVRERVREALADLWHDPKRWQEKARPLAVR
ncbi:MAG: host attachment protein [Bdellovibrionota bacterium]